MQLDSAFSHIQHVEQYLHLNELVILGQLRQVERGVEFQLESGAEFDAVVQSEIRHFIIVVTSVHHCVFQFAAIVFKLD